LIASFLFCSIFLGLLSTIEKVLQQHPCQLILTGGDAQLFAQPLQIHQPIIQQDLLLKGLSVYLAHQTIA